MPVYTVEHPTSDRTITIEGDTPPSERQLDEIFKSIPTEGAAPEPKMTSKEYGAKLAQTPEYRALAAEFLKKEGKRNLAQEAVRGLPMGNRLANAFLGPYTNPVYPERTLNEQMGPVTESSNTGSAMLRGLGNFMANPAPQIEGAIAFPADVTTGAAKALYDPTTQEAQQFGPNLIKGVAAPLGLADVYSGDMTFPEARKAWEHEFLGSAMTAAGAVKGSAKLSGKVSDIASKAADLGVEKLSPSSWTPSGTVSKKGGFTADAKQSRLDRLQEKSPNVIENRVQNAAENLIPPDRTSADPAVRAATLEKMKTGVDNIEQLAAEGAIHEHNAKGEVVLDADGVPKPYVVGKGGVVGAVKPAMQALQSVWDEVKGVLSRSTAEGTKIPTKNVPGLEKFNGEVITPEQLQAEISALNEVLYKTKDGVLSLEDTAKRNVLKRAVGNMNEMLDNAVSTGLEDLGMKDLHAQWGGVRQFTDAVLNGAERKLMGGTAPTPMDVPLHGGIGYKATGVVGRTINKYFKNPDRAFENLIRARRAQGNNVRERFVDPTQDMPQQPTVYDPSTGMQIQASGQGSGGPTTNVGGQPQVAIDPVTGVRSTYQPTGPTTNVGGHRQGSEPQVGYGPTTNVGGHRQGSEPQVGYGPTTNVGGQPQVSAPDIVGASSVEKGVKGTAAPAEVKPAPSIEAAHTPIDLKQATKDAGGGKNGTALVAQAIGVPAAVLSMWLMGSDKKRKSILVKYPQLGGYQ